MTLDTASPWVDATDLADQLRDRRLKAIDLVDGYLERIARTDAHWHAYVDVHADSAQAQARAADHWRDSGLPCPPLLGLPLSLKDLFHVEGRVTTFGSATRRDAIAPDTSAVVRALLRAGAILLGKTHMGEFAYGGWGINPHMGTPRNPWSPAGAHHAPGGSSSGAAVSVAANLACAAIGSDTGGSVRVPAALTGLTGFKPTYDRIDLAGSLAMCPSLDSIGVITRSARDARLLFDALVPTDDAREADTPPRIAYLPPDAYPCEVSPAVLAAHDAMLSAWRDLGATVHPVTPPFDIPTMMRSSDDLILAEAHAVHADTIHDPAAPFGPWVAGRIRSGRDITAQRYLRAVAQRAHWRALYAERVRPYDAYLMPATPTAAPALANIDEDRTTIGVFTRLVNCMGACALALPAGLDEAGLPIGMQLVGRPYDDRRLLTLGERLQAATDWHRRRAPLA